MSIAENSIPPTARRGQSVPAARDRRHEMIDELDTELVLGFAWGPYTAWRITSSRHEPRYFLDEIVFVTDDGKVAGFVPTAAVALAEALARETDSV